MARKFLKSERHVFWEAFLIAVFIFSLGLMIGVFLEMGRQGDIEKLYSISELQLLDLKIQNEIFEFKNFSCENAIQENLKLADSIYEEALLLKDLEESQRLTDALMMQHKKYDLLRTLLWVNSIKINERCEDSFHTVVYIYEYDPGIDIRAKQNTFSKSLGELKNEVGSRIILIPIAGNMDLRSTEALMKEYKVEKLPVIIIDEKILIYEIEELKEIEGHLS